MKNANLTEDEMIEILEDLARNGGETARISAIRQLRDIRRERGEEPEKAPADDSLKRLYRSRPAPGPRRRRGAPA